MEFSIYSILIVAILASALTNTSALSDEKKAEIREKIKPVLEDCGKQHGVTFEQMKEFREQNKRPDDSNKCFFACLFKKTGLLNDKGLYAEDVAVQKITKYADESKLEQAKTAAKSCTSVNEATVTDGEAGCDRAKLLFDCIVQQRELYGF